MLAGLPLLLGRPLVAPAVVERVVGLGGGGVLAGLLAGGADLLDAGVGAAGDVDGAQRAPGVVGGADHPPEAGGAGLGRAAHGVALGGQRPAEHALEPAHERGQSLVGGDGDGVAAVPVGAGVGLPQARREPDRAQHAQPPRLDRAADELLEGPRALLGDLGLHPVGVDRDEVAVDHRVELADARR